MKFRTNKLSLKIALAGALLAASLPALAKTGDTDQPIHIESDQQSLDMQGNVVTFTGNVVVTQGTIKINADKVVVTRPGNEKGKEVIEGFGNPATFYQMQDNGKAGKRPGVENALRAAERLRRADGQRLSGTARQQHQGRQDHLSGERAKNAGLQRQRSTRHHRSGAVRAAGQKRQPAKEE